MERDFIFLRCVTGIKKNGDRYYFIDILKTNFEPVRYWYNDNVIAFNQLAKKLKPEDALKTFKGVFTLDDKDDILLTDVK